MAFLKERGNASSTQNQRLAALKSYIWFAADKDISLQSIALDAKRIHSFKVKKKKLEVLSHDALTSIFAQPSNSKMGLRDRSIMIVLYDSAIRLDELLKLKLLDVQIKDSPYLRINGKGSKERVVPISLKTASHLQQYIEVFHGKSSPKTDLLFYTFIKGNVGAMSESNVERFIKKYANKARESCEEIPQDVFPHLIRRTRATDLYQNGVEIELVARLLGHVSVETTRKYYAKPSLKMLTKAINSVDVPECEQETPLWEDGEKLMAKICGLR
jgi:site-specific recombinase XerD